MYRLQEVFVCIPPSHSENAPSCVTRSQNLWRMASSLGWILLDVSHCSWQLGFVLFTILFHFPVAELMAMCGFTIELSLPCFAWDIIFC